MKSVDDGNSKSRRLIGSGFLVTLQVATSFLLSACYGPYYHPVFPENNTTSFSIGCGPGEGPPDRLGMEIDGCYASLSTRADEGNLWVLLDWEGVSLYGKECALEFYPEPLVIEDLDTGSRKEIKIFRRKCMYDVSLDIDQPVDLLSHIPGFAAVPPSERRYTMAISLKRKFKGPLPETSRIQLPDISVGSRIIKPPPLELIRHNVILSDYYDYIPVSWTEEVTSETSVSGAFGSIGSTPVYVWHEESSLLRLAVLSRGYPYIFDNYGRPNKDFQQISATIFVEVFGDEVVHLKDRQVAWHVPGDRQGHSLSVKNNAWYLLTYTTSHLSEHLRHLPLYYDHDHKNGPLQSYHNYRGVIPDFHPKKFRLTLPSAKMNGVDWPIPPIDFIAK